MEFYTVFIFLGIILLLSGAYLWLRPKIMKRDDTDQPVTDESAKGFLLISALLTFAMAFLFKFFD